MQMRLPYHLVTHTFSWLGGMARLHNCGLQPHMVLTRALLPRLLALLLGLNLDMTRRYTYLHNMRRKAELECSQSLKHKHKTA
jgi:hypothetical protein